MTIDSDRMGGRAPGKTLAARRRCTVSHARWQDSPMTSAGAPTSRTPLPRRGLPGIRRSIVVAREAFQLAWATDKRALLAIAALQLVRGVALGAELLVGKELLDSIG